MATELWFEGHEVTWPQKQGHLDQLFLRKHGLREVKMPWGLDTAAEPGWLENGLERCLESWAGFRPLSGSFLQEL